MAEHKLHKFHTTKLTLDNLKRKQYPSNRFELWINQTASYISSIIFNRYIISHYQTYAGYQYASNGFDFLVKIQQTVSHLFRIISNSLINFLLPMTKNNKPHMGLSYGTTSHIFLHNFQLFPNLPKPNNQFPSCSLTNLKSLNVLSFLTEQLSNTIQL